MIKIKEAALNRRKKSIEITLTDKRSLELPFSKFPFKFNAASVIEIYVDKELGSRGVSCTFSNGKSCSIPLDAFLDYNRDPNYLKEMMTYQLTVEVLQYLEKGKVSKNELTRRLQTSPSQLARLLDTSNKNKSVDQMLRLLAVLGCDVELKVKPSKISA